MKSTLLAITMAAGLVTTALVGEENKPQGDARPENWILEHGKDSASAAQLTPREEAEHQERVKRLHELASESRAEIQEAAGADSRATTSGGQQKSPQSTSANVSWSSDSMERLIEAVEELQMEVRQLNIS